MTQKKRPTAAEVLSAIQEAAARCRREKEERRRQQQREYTRQYRERRQVAKTSLPQKLQTSIVAHVHQPCDNRVCMCNVNGLCGHRECPTNKRIIP